MIGSRTKFLYTIGILLFVIIVPLGILLIIKYNERNKKDKFGSIKSSKPLSSTGTTGSSTGTAGSSTGTTGSSTGTLTTPSKPLTTPSKPLTTPSKPLTTPSKPLTTPSKPSTKIIKPPKEIFNSPAFCEEVNRKPKPLYSNLKYCGKIGESKYMKALEKGLEHEIHIMEGDNSNTNDNIHYRIKIEQLKKISTKSYVNPRSDGTCGYIALFATLYPFLKDKNHEVSKVFFDSTGYDTIQGLPKPLRYKTISELFTVLKNNMEVHKDLYEYVEYNKVNIVLALRYLAIKRVWNDEKLKKKLMEEKIKSSSELYKFSDSIQPNKVDTFKDLFVPHFLDSEHLGKRAYWMEEFDIDLFSHILNINICAIMISPSSEINNKKYADSAYFVRGVLLITSEDCVYNVNSPMDKNIIANLPVVCLINDCQLCHYLGVIC